MAFVRKHGNQLALVHGERDAKNGVVRQRVLFSFYSRAEAKAAIGEGGEQDKHYFQYLLRSSYPRIKFNWEAIYGEIKANIDHLPELYPRSVERLMEPFEDSLDSFARLLIPSEIFMNPSALEVLDRSKDDLIALKEILEFRLRALESSRSSNKEMKELLNDRFAWHYLVKQSRVPGDIEEWAEQFYLEQNYEKARRIFKLLVRCFENYADGYNYLGLIAYETHQLRDAVAYFEKTVEVGRTLFGKRLPKKDYWYVLETRPFVRGLRNLALSLIRLEEFSRALEVCDKLDKTCGDKFYADSYRASVYLNQRAWQKSLDHCLDLEYASLDAFVAAFACFELGKYQLACEHFLYAAFNNAFSARNLIEVSYKKKPKSYSEVLDQNSGVYSKMLIDRYLSSAKSALKYFSSLLSFDVVQDVFKQIDGLEGKTREEHDSFKKLHELKSQSYSRLLVEKLPTEFLYGLRLESR